jgi:hypothetical protein
MVKKSNYIGEQKDTFTVCRTCCRLPCKWNFRFTQVNDTWTHQSARVPTFVSGLPENFILSAENTLGRHRLVLRGELVIVSLDRDRKRLLKIIGVPGVKSWSSHVLNQNWRMFPCAESSKNLVLFSPHFTICVRFAISFRAYDREIPPCNRNSSV